MDKENQWSEINKDVADIAKKVKSKMDEEDFEKVADEIIMLISKYKNRIETIKKS